MKKIRWIRAAVILIGGYWLYTQARNCSTSGPGSYPANMPDFHYDGHDLQSPSNQATPGVPDSSQSPSYKTYDCTKQENIDNGICEE